MRHGRAEGDMRTSALKLPHVLHLSRTQLIRPGHALGMLQYDGRIIWKPPTASEDQLRSDVDVATHGGRAMCCAPLGGQSGGRAMCCGRWAIETDRTARLSDQISS